MLQPNERSLFLDALRPPMGYRLDMAIGTTYSLDLLTLLTTFYSFSFGDWEDDNGKPLEDPKAIFKAVCENGEKVIVFCQSGRIAIPKKYHQMFCYLESSIYECKAPIPGGNFHPKLWVLRYQNNVGYIRYKVICATGNLTDDFSWDAMVVLDGEVTNQKRGLTVSRPLSDFILSLPSMAVRNIPPDWNKKIRRLAKEIHRTRFDIPDKFQKLKFFPLGIKDYRKNPYIDVKEQFLIMSPFLDEQALKELSDIESEDILISRLDTLQKINPDFLERFHKVYSFSQSGSPIDDEMEMSNNESEDKSYKEVHNRSKFVSGNGLHAKLYIADEGWSGKVWIGSANATNAALNKNVEFVIKLVGKKSYCGINALLKKEKYCTNFADLLEEYSPDPKDYKPIDPKILKQEKMQDEVVVQIEKARLIASVSSSESNDFYNIVISSSLGKKIELPPNVRVIIYPISLKKSAAELVKEPSQIASFKNVSLESLTPFFAFSINIIKNAVVDPRQFVMQLPLKGAPQDRRERVIQYLFQNREQVLQFLMLYLIEPERIRLADIIDVHQKPPRQPHPKLSILKKEFFESLVKTLWSRPENIDCIHKFIEDIRKAPNSAELLPEGFDEIWEPIWKARQEMNK